MIINTAFQKFVDWILQALPPCPFAGFNLGNYPYVSYINWFFPVSECLDLMAAWLVAIGVYYVYSIVARWVKIIS